MKMQKFETVIETITPARAKAYLEANTRNRRVRRHKVEAFTRLIREGKWQTTHQGIAFNCDGTLLDGQHRLEAIVAADIAVKMMVTRGMPRDAIYGIDQGTNRDGLDVAESLGVDLDLNKVHFSIARGMMFSGSFGAAYTVGKIAIHEHIAYVQSHYDSIAFAASLSLGPCNNAIIRAVIARAWYTANRERLVEFARILATGVVEAKTDAAAIAFRNALMTKGVSVHGASNRTDVYAKCESALRAFLKHEPLAKVYSVAKEVFPIPGDE